MIVLAVLWYMYEEAIYWIWWAIADKELDFYEKNTWAFRVFWIVLLLTIIYLYYGIK